MNETSPQLKRFARRVRVVRSWQGLAIGACIGAAFSTGWAVMDALGFAYCEGLQLAIAPAAAATIGAIVGALRPISTQQLSVSIDRRAHLEDRMTTALERTGGQERFDQDVQQDAALHLATVKPKTIYPIRMLRWHGGTLALIAMTTAIFLLGNSPIFLDANAKKTRQELKEEAKKVERIRKENLETPEAEGKLTDAERRLADEMRRLQRDLEKARMSKEESRQRANEIAKKAEELSRSAAKDSLKSLEKAETARQQMMKDQLQEMGMPNVDPQLMEMSDSEREQAMKSAENSMNGAMSKMNSLQGMMSALDQKLKNPNLTDAERKALEEQKKAMEKAIAASKKELEDAKRRMDDLRLSAQAQKVFARMRNSPLFKKLQELAQKLKENAKAGMKENNGTPKISREELLKIKAELEALAKKLEDPKAMDAYLKSMMEALMREQCSGNCAGIGMSMGLSLPIPGPGGKYDIMSYDSGKINKLSKEAAGAGKTTATMISGSRRETAGEDAYIEIKAPTTVGTRSSVPYIKVLPSYRKKAESALNRQEIPKEYQERVRQYFGGLGKQP